MKYSFSLKSHIGQRFKKLVMLWEVLLHIGHCLGREVANTTRQKPLLPLRPESINLLHRHDARLSGVSEISDHSEAICHPRRIFHAMRATDAALILRDRPCWHHLAHATTRRQAAGKGL